MEALFMPVNFPAAERNEFWVWEPKIQWYSDKGKELPNAGELNPDGATPHPEYRGAIESSVTLVKPAVHPSDTPSRDVGC